MTVMMASTFITQNREEDNKDDEPKLPKRKSGCMGLAT